MPELGRGARSQMSSQRSRFGSSRFCRSYTFLRSERRVVGKTSKSLTEWRAQLEYSAAVCRSVRRTIFWMSTSLIRPACHKAEGTRRS